MYIFRHRVTKKSKSDYCFKIENDKKAPFFIVAAVEVKFSVVLDSSALYVGEGNEGGQGVQVDIRRDWWQDSTELCSQKCLVGNWKCAIFLRQLPMKVCWNQSLEGQLLETVFGKSTFLTFMRIFQKTKSLQGFRVYQKWTLARNRWKFYRFYRKTLACSQIQ